MNGMFLMMFVFKFCVLSAALVFFTLFAFAVTTATVKRTLIDLPQPASCGLFPVFCKLGGVASWVALRPALLT